MPRSASAGTIASIARGLSAARSEWGRRTRPPARRGTSAWPRTHSSVHAASHDRLAREAVVRAAAVAHEPLVAEPLVRFASVVRAKRSSARCAVSALSRRPCPVASRRATLGQSRARALGAPRVCTGAGRGAAALSSSQARVCSCDGCDRLMSVASSCIHPASTLA